MSEDLSLFGDDDRAPRPAEAVPPAVAPIADWQVDLLRKALDARGLTSMDERKAAIELAAARPVEALRALTHDEALKVLSNLGPTGGTLASRSAWDERDADTWIDRL
ncbi:hypothetical protein [Nocardioides ganghwensis]|uniref:Uncharacterized protein n=1 Tax=Nocardioides ganghwensis TaxID=252230 RepID=A0A4Q2S9D8_9ACTN|nr:hypothetical protein [Nocardioides ganghwensis]MBD3947601.1 hypothetical protein [Nocardioides ganghwensis]RYB99383.1 hypothetical protein EUA07_16275 [Nocardioides ganghwensis]